MYCAVFIRCTTAITRCHSLPFAVSCCHSLYYSLSHFVTCCTTRCHALSFVVTRCHSVSLVVIRCHLLPFVVTRCTTCYHSSSLDAPLVRLFINDLNNRKKRHYNNIFSTSLLLSWLALSLLKKTQIIFYQYF